MKTLEYKYFLELLSPEEKSNAPKELFHEGDLSLLFKVPKVSVVGSRKVSPEGAKRAEIITKALVKKAITVVSGLAMGVDTIAHETAIANGGRTITVLGTPLDKCTPSSNRNLLSRIKSEHLALSQFPLGSNVYPSNFPTRNKTMALISDATIIIEASENSGTKHQGWEALRLGKMVLIMESVVKNPKLTWPKEMVDYGAIPLTRSNFEGIFDEIKELSFSMF